MSQKTMSDPKTTNTGSIPHRACRTPGECRREQVCFDGWQCASDKTTIKWGSFVVRQGGITVASGSGPWEDCKREALRYSAAYQQDGPVSVTVRRRKPRVRHG